jgi:polysaccharide export outer membrane protein
MSLRTLIRSASWYSLAALLLFAFSALAQTKGTATEATRPSHNYVIGPGDVLQIIVMNEPQASVPVVVVRSDGMISIPLLKEVAAAGLTPRELEKLITQSLSRLIRDADVTVLVKEIHSEKVYMIGALRREGPIVLAGPLTVLQAISEAGGFTDYAKRSRIYVLRQDHGKQMRYPFDYNAVIRGDHPEQNITLLPGDSVVVPQ